VAIIKEVWETEVYEQDTRVQPGDVVVDAGAHIGGFTIKVVNTAGKVIAFEPEPNNFQLLRLNTKPYRNVEVHQKALWSKSGKARLYRHKLNVGGSSILPLAPEITDCIVDVETVRLDEVVSKVDFIKMDVEGSEIEALKGASMILEAYHPVIVMEAHPVPPLDLWWKELSDLLHSFNYDIKHFPSPMDMWQRRIVTAT
jgi:FkbM family methyltransferase